MVNTKVTLCGIEMDNPIIPASGTFSHWYRDHRFYHQLPDHGLLGP